MMVLLTANLKAGWVAEGGVDSEIRDLRIAFCEGQDISLSVCLSLVGERVLVVRGMGGRG